MPFEYSSDLFQSIRLVLSLCFLSLLFFECLQISTLQSYFSQLMLQFINPCLILTIFMLSFQDQVLFFLDQLLIFTLSLCMALLLQSKVLLQPGYFGLKFDNFRIEQGIVLTERYKSLLIFDVLVLSLECLYLLRVYFDSRSTEVILHVELFYLNVSNGYFLLQVQVIMLCFFIEGKKLLILLIVMIDYILLLLLDILMLMSSVLSQRLQLITIPF